MLMGTARRSDELEQSLCETRSRKGTLLYVNELSVLCLSRDDAFTSLPGGHLIAPYVDTVIEGCVKVATMARDALEPAWLTTGKGSCTYSREWHNYVIKPPCFAVNDVCILRSR